MHSVLLHLGSNLGQREALLARAVALIGTGLGQVVAASALYETAPWGGVAQPDYLNQALCLRSELPPLALMAALLDIEAQLGRRRRQRWGSRHIDIDMLGYGAQVMDTPQLCLPHPRLHLRRFVLVPLADIAPDWAHPLLGLSVRELLERCPDALPVRRFLPTQP